MKLKVSPVQNDEKWKIMKKLKLILACVLLCTTTTFADVRINEENFPCENFRNWLLEQDFGSKGYITDAEIESVREINVSRQNISDLTGIKFFVNLERLDCSYNLLTSLDVSGLNYLWYFFCQNNQLTSLDVSDLINLVWLNCSRNQLTSLNVSGLTNLTWLICFNNQLTSLDVSGLINLQRLLCENNQLISLDVSGLNYLWEFRCNNNQLTFLDVSSLNNLRVLLCENNQLTSLNVSGLNYLWKLRCNNNQLTSLDVSSLNNLEKLWFSYNHLISIDLTGLDSLNLDLFKGYNQTLTLTLSGANNNYSVEIELNNPTNLADGLSYSNGTLTSTSSTITTSPFTVETGNPNFILSGTLKLNYKSQNQDIED